MNFENEDAVCLGWLLMLRDWLERAILERLHAAQNQANVFFCGFPLTIPQRLLELRVVVFNSPSRDLAVALQASGREKT